MPNVRITNNDNEGALQNRYPLISCFGLCSKVAYLFSII